MTDMSNPPYGWLLHRAETIVEQLARSEKPDYAGAMRELTFYGKPKEISMILSQISKEGIRGRNISLENVLLEILSLVEGDEALDALLSYVPRIAFVEKASQGLASRKSVPHLLKALDLLPSYSWESIAPIIRALGECGDISAVPKLIGIIGNTDYKESPRALAATALGNLGGKEAVLALVSACQNDVRTPLCSAVINALEKNKEIALPALLSRIESCTASESPKFLWALVGIAGYANSTNFLRIMVMQPVNAPKRKELMKKLAIIHSISGGNNQKNEASPISSLDLSGLGLKKFPTLARTSAQPVKIAQVKKVQFA